MGGRNREQAASVVQAHRGAAQVPAGARQDVPQVEEPADCAAQDLVRPQVGISAELHACFPDLKVERNTLQGVCDRGRQKRELNRLRRFKKQHNVKVDKEGTAGNSAQNEELSELIKQMEMMGKEVEEARNAKQEAEEHNAFLNRVVSVKNEEIKDLQLKVRAEKKKVAVFGKQLEAANGPIRVAAHALREHRRHARHSRRRNLRSRKNIVLKDMETSPPVVKVEVTQQQQASAAVTPEASQAARSESRSMNEKTMRAATKRLPRRM
ncbi:hypothetical protein ON010_g15265 [Phytophthora cinnamomi]|nr:hypothetical protein ON010_g15265 [Phytophthora cinnamomi]